MLSGRRIVLGITGSIAAYKAADLARQLVKAGAEVTVVMTENACRFITPLTFRTLTRGPVITGFFAEQAEPVPHIALAQWAELILIAPATADTIAKTAVGRADDLLTAMLLDTTAPILWAPAMNTRMWDNSVTRENVKKLTQRGHHWVQPTEGELACAETGRGRLAEVEDIVAAVQNLLLPASRLTGKQVLITAGPTREPWDAIRFLSNRSSGKMGYALAEEARRRGAKVTLLSGPVALIPPAGIDLVTVNTAREMYAAAKKAFVQTDIFMAAAAVADFRPAESKTNKIKKSKAPETIALVPNPDILLELGQHKGEKIVVGFAAESDKVVDAAKQKRVKKNCDLMVANAAGGEADAFAADHAQVFILDNQDQVEALPSLPKAQVASVICDRIETLIKEKNSPHTQKTGTRRRRGRKENEEEK
ncbi:bifunctional phosphopantothenoylcysteine decarboxylase/phosphopantothenate--cysteine ligase CoaBC [bacterium]|nr:bifunctional phosphopantothenoylcysteine decarboxylase/phosphopantothenate--cysteine ligase CoaBC [bacterium]